MLSSDPDAVRYARSAATISRRTSRRRVVSSSTTAGSSRPRATSSRRSARRDARNSARAASASCSCARALTRGSSSSANVSRAADVGGATGLVAHVASCRRQVGAQRLHRVGDGCAHLVGEAAHRVAELGLDAVELGAARVELGAPGIRDRVDGLAAVGLLRHEALLFELGEPRVDRAGARHVGAAEAVAQRLDQLVAVHRPLGEEAEQVEPQVSVREDRRDSCLHRSEHADVASHRVDAQVDPVLVELAELAGVAALDAADLAVVELELSADRVDRVRRRDVGLEPQGDARR